MGIESDDDLNLFLEVDDFAIVATYVPAGKRGFYIKGIFDNPHASITATQMMDVTIPQPKFLCRTVDVVNAAEGDSLKIGATTYTIRIVLTDGLGMTTLLMEKNL